MLVELSIKHFAIIDQLTVPFQKGLTVITGETGAGKSIIIDAIGLLLGGRGSADYVRYGEQRAEIEGLFHVEEGNRALEKAKDLGIDVSDQMFILRRDITTQGKSICRINGKMVTIAILREIGQTLVDIHGQHEHQSLMQPEHHMHLLDEYAGVLLKRTRLEYQELYKKALQLQQQVVRFSTNEQEMAQKVDLYQFQLNEIEQAQLEPLEDERLLEERHKLQHSEKLFSLLQDSYQSLFGENRGLDFLANATAHLEEAATIDKELSALHENVSNSFYLLEEAAFTLRNQMELIEFDPARLEVVESRLHELTQLKRKYGSTVEEMMEYAARIEEELDSLVHKDDRLSELIADLEAAWKDLYVEAQTLTKLRKEAAHKLKKAIHSQLRSLYMEKTEFDVSIQPRVGTKDSPIIDGQAVAFNEGGMDEIEFYLSTNPGEPLKPLAKVASGGEISRIMLAIKSIFSHQEGITSVIFDEVDTGVSGRVAQAIAEKIHRISEDSQVLCITHLPQVAAMADTHLYISKHEEDQRVRTSVNALTKGEKVNEIARMISGVEVTDLTKQHANELLQLAETLKV
ncbi:DNA repair protein RecN [Alkalihalobacillus hemicellulosilyticus]|uniref:DNA repair protein RecN n=1 Tax=Halalkalibacter hemicellulosilyticusJCM 9152 TaxID=1236971 RepID=W4QJU2_9BACI|nr:DNA repair protein RecN [Halalkalibacter hemicellulosilyticus]GAE31888.1 DNA repair protein RecN [Halalkalibacter hemicellulosilyticusJCM 9152]